ncbi:hypothetical protein POM88_001370 [Heracleum sosnowskyi]|uniref:Uncharacterized protein n=1 Tax=Heracleum sosnowskyi TaxID=360622 RepID=A0AAD8JC00_9APIA|nr:hypothetical protein POM88_001370 [Heracleum sosnowskyi]
MVSALQIQAKTFRFCRSSPGVIHNVIDCWCWHRKFWKRVRSNNENVAPITLDEKGLKETGRRRSLMLYFCLCYGYLYYECGGPGLQNMLKGRLRMYTYTILAMLDI